MPYESIICGDNLERMPDIPDGVVDLCYADPPFFSNKRYEIIWHDADEIRSFEDRWSGGMDEYIEWMRPRVQEIFRVLKSTGSFYLHCDNHADSYLRVMCDQIFSNKNYQVGILWHYTTGGASKKIWSTKTDTILMYTKGKSWTFNYDKVMVSYSKSTIDRLKYGGARTKDPNKIKRIESGEIGKVPDNVWDISSVQGNSKESKGYPTQKPEALLERIISASSNPGDVVFDPFCGCGTALAVAKRLSRQFIGIDISPMACRVVADRLYPDTVGANTDKIDGYVRNSEDAAKLSHQGFQNWVNNELNAIPNKTNTNDKGIDGRVRQTNYPVQAKQRKIGRNDIDNFSAAMRRDKAMTGAIVGIPAHKPGELPVYPKSLIVETNRLKRDDGVTIFLYTVEDLVTKKPAADYFSTHHKSVKRKPDLLDFNKNPSEGCLGK